ncbi:translation protein SH3-like domain-containing protein [Umbelopsis sp. PMI_123]|nr:translation protein SH3-like domain-containing protein [Umbelopsis sp. PMI_123]
MHRFKAQGMSTRLFKRSPWVAPKDRVKTWNIVTGDKVAIIAGKDKDTIGEIKSVDRRRNLVVVDGKKLAKKHVPKQPSAPDGIMRQEQAMHISNVMLLDPETQRPTKIDRRRVEKETKDGRKVMKWTRFVHGTDIEISKPGKRYDDVRSDEFKSTSATEALKVTFEPSLISPPMPSEILKELANPYRRS